MLTLLESPNVPAWQQDPYIQRGYRPISHSYRLSLQSLMYVHNQTVNVYTHLLGFTIFAIFAYLNWDPVLARYETATHEDKIVFSAFLAGLLACLGFSSAFHTFSNHSEDVCRKWLACDFFGILCLIAGSWIPGIYYGFYCQRSTVQFYVGLILSLTILSLIVLLVPTFRTPKWKHFRTTMFLSLGISGFVPMTSAAKAYGVYQAHQQMGWGWFLLEGVFYILGAAIYASRYPERAIPRKCDIWGSSHQIFHVAVLAGAAAHLRGIMMAFEYNHNPETRLC
ncbi:hypothetical protein NX059_009126 [Plenodomus lindquistii]|nr:hypothetical protein NX059_009126 [Plenodomus lindquistii]